MKFAESVAKHREDPEYRRLEEEMDFEIKFGEEVYLSRKAKGISQTELARRVGTKQANISRIESGFGNPKLAMVSKICRELGISLWTAPCLSGKYNSSSDTKSVPMASPQITINLSQLTQISAEESASGKCEMVYA